MDYPIMTNQTIFIINFNLLYEILEEIKETLSFNIIRSKTKEDLFKEDNINFKNCLIISQSNLGLISSKNLNEKNFLVLNDFPIPIIKLVELINIHLIKLRFNYQSKIIINDYDLNINSKFLSKNKVVLKLTEKEVEIILYLNKTKKKHGVLDLQKNIWGYSKDMETHTVETHIYRLRKKINNKFKDENFILSHQDGYFVCDN
tara:strand:+ start:3279 stop:3887 length:609 start_codon:yes stop_codon:yes gene_type:complete